MASQSRVTGLGEVRQRIASGDDALLKGTHLTGHLRYTLRITIGRDVHKRRLRLTEPAKLLLLTRELLGDRRGLLRGFSLLFPQVGCRELLRLRLKALRVEGFDFAGGFCEVALQPANAVACFDDSVGQFLELAYLLVGEVFVAFDESTDLLVQVHLLLAVLIDGLVEACRERKLFGFLEGRLLEEGCVGHLAAFGVERLDCLVEVLFDQLRVQQPVATEGRVGAGIELGQSPTQFGRIEVRFERESATKTLLLLFEPFHPRVEVLRIGFEIELYGGVLAVPFAVGAFKTGGVRFEYRVHVEVAYSACGLLDLTAETLRIRSDTNDDCTGAMFAHHKQPPERKKEIENPHGNVGVCSKSGHVELREHAFEVLRCTFVLPARRLLVSAGREQWMRFGILAPVFGGNHRVHHVANLNGDHRLRIPSKPRQYGRLVRLGLIGRGWRLILQYPRPVQAVGHRHQPRREAFGAGGIQPRAGYVQTIETLEVGSQFDRVDADLRFEASDFPSWSV